MSTASIDSQYSGWDPLIAVREALKHDRHQVENDREDWTHWLAVRGVETLWLPRLSIDDQRFGDLIVVEEAYEYVASPPRVFGLIEDPNAGASLALRSQGGRYWTTRDARVVGGWDVVTTLDGACWPALDADMESRLVSNALDLRLLGWTESSMIVRKVDGMRRRRSMRSGIRRRNIRRIDSAIMLVGEHAGQYGHWLIDYLVRCLAVKETPPSTPILIDADVPVNSRWWLQKVLPDRPVIPLARGESVAVGTLFVPLQRTFCPTGWIESMELTPEVWSFDPRAVGQIQALATAGEPDRTRHKRLWLGRRSDTKPLLNQTELFESVLPHGFELVYPEDFSMGQFQNLLAETRDVIVPLGSQQLNVLASSPGLRLLVLLGGAMGQVRGSAAIAGTACGHEVALVGGQDAGPLGRNPYEQKQRAYTVSRDLLDAAHRRFFSDQFGG